MQSVHRWYLEHVSVKQLGCRSILFPACKTITNANPVSELKPGVKYRLHVYCDPNTKIDPRSFIRLKAFNGKHSQILQLNKDAEKRFKQNSEEFEVSCFDFSGKDIGASIGGVIWTNSDTQPWYCHQVQIQICKIVTDGKSTWSLAKIFPVENWYVSHLKYVSQRDITY